MSSIKREIGHFHVVVVQKQAKKCTKKRDARAKLLFCLWNLLFFWRSRCHPRRWILKSVLLLGLVLTYPDIFESAILSFPFQKFPRPHVSVFKSNLPFYTYPTRIDTRIRIHFSGPVGRGGGTGCARTPPPPQAPEVHFFVDQPLKTKWINSIYFQL